MFKFDRMTVHSAPFSPPSLDLLWASSPLATHASTQVGVLDLGGASMQITFVPEADRSVLQPPGRLVFLPRRSGGRGR